VVRCALWMAVVDFDIVIVCMHTLSELRETCLDDMYM
jgi:hypothetical protein